MVTECPVWEWSSSSAVSCENSIPKHWGVIKSKVPTSSVLLRSGVRHRCLGCTSCCHYYCNSHNARQIPSRALRLQSTWCRLECGVPLKVMCVKRGIKQETRGNKDKTLMRDNADEVMWFVSCVLGPICWYTMWKVKNLFSGHILC